MRLDDGGTVWVVVRVYSNMHTQEISNDLRVFLTNTEMVKLVCAFATEREARDHIAAECSKFIPDSDYRHRDELHVIPVNTSEGEVDE